MCPNPGRWDMICEPLTRMNKTSSFAIIKNFLYYYLAPPPAPASTQPQQATAGPAKPKGKDAKSAPKAVPGRRKRSSMSASSASPTSPKSATSSTPLSPMQSPLACSPCSASGAHNKHSAPKVIKAGKQVKAKKEGFMSVPLESKTAPAADESPLVASVKPAVVEAKPGPVEKISSTTGKPVVPPPAFKVTSKPAVAAPVSFSDTIAASPPKSVEVKTMPPKMVDDDLPPLIPPEKPVKVPVVLPPAAVDVSKCATSPTKPCGPPKSVPADVKAAPVEAIKVAPIVPSKAANPTPFKVVPIKAPQPTAKDETVQGASLKPVLVEGNKSVIGNKVPMAQKVPSQDDKCPAPKPAADLPKLAPTIPAPRGVAADKPTVSTEAPKPVPNKAPQQVAEVKSAPVESEPKLTEVPKPDVKTSNLLETKLSDVKATPTESAKPNILDAKPVPVEPAVAAPTPRKLTFAEAVAKPAPVKPEVVNTTPIETISSPTPAPTPAKAPAKVEPVIKNDQGILLFFLNVLPIFHVFLCSLS